jgi:hypothetical protein
VNTRARITVIPALFAAGAVASLPGILKTAAAQDASPAAGAAEVPAAWADLGLPEIELQFTSSEITGMPESVEAGRYLVSIYGEPMEQDWAFAPTFLQLPEGMTIDDLASADVSQGPPEFFYESLVPGGPVILASSGATSAVGIVDLQPGEWVVAGSALAQPPSPFTVTGEVPAELPEPESSATFTIGEMVINLSEGTLNVGDNLVKVDNIGAQPHFVNVDKAPDGTTTEDVEALIASFMSATPTATALTEEDLVTVAFSNEQSGQTAQWSVMTFTEPGTYLATCWIPDPESGTPHAAMGMYTVFEVS